ncbi:hypothetical protein AMECASPLE_003849 [Ameca splendens]|uniref:Uncharacterized protein n=1 Tax=Ameca splendens TaxID=208324 RepID=A0ABV0ZIH8_9TELE
MMFNRRSLRQRQQNNNCPSLRSMSPIVWDRRMNIYVHMLQLPGNMPDSRQNRHDDTLDCKLCHTVCVSVVAEQYKIPKQYEIHRNKALYISSKIRENSKQQLLNQH